MFGQVENRYLLTMGNSLDSCKEDVKRIISLYATQCKKVAEKYECFPKYELLEFIKDIIFESNDLLIIHFSGHGEYLGKRINGKMEMVSTWINPDGTHLCCDEVTDILSKLNCKILLISDSCHSGNFGKFYDGNNIFIFMGSSSILKITKDYTISSKEKAGILINILEKIDIFNTEYQDIINGIQKFCRIYKIRNNVIFLKKEKEFKNKNI